MKPGDKVQNKSTKRVARITCVEEYWLEDEKSTRTIYVLDGEERHSKDSFEPNWELWQPDDEKNVIFWALKDVIPFTSKTQYVIADPRQRYYAYILKKPVECGWHTYKRLPIPSEMDYERETLLLNRPLMVNGKCYKYGYSKTADILCIAEITEAELEGMLHVIHELRLPITFVKAMLD